MAKKVLDDEWLAARSTDVQLTGVELTTTNPPSSNTSHWIPAVVPGTYALYLLTFAFLFLCFVTLFI